MTSVSSTVLITVKARLKGRGFVKLIKAYIVDSQVIIRRMMINILRAVHEVELLGATSGKDEEGVMRALDRLEPDVLLLGIEHSESVEMELFHRIREKHPDLAVIVMAPKNVAGATVALETLKSGAVECLSIPDRQAQIPLARRHFLLRAVPALRMIPRLNRGKTQTVHSLLNRNDRDDLTVPDPVEPKNQPRPELIVIGGDSGGVSSLLRLVEELPHPIPVPVVVIQHLPKFYTRALAEELDKLTPMPVREAFDGCELEPGQIYLVPGGQHADLRNRSGRLRLNLHRGPKVQCNRPSIDLLLQSASQACGCHLLTIILSGGGRDGVRGCETVTRSGGTVLVESGESAMLWDLPNRVVRNSTEAEIIPLSALPVRLSNLFADGDTAAGQESLEQISRSETADTEEHQ